jgi:hypothetical protein
MDESIMKIARQFSKLVFIVLCGSFLLASEAYCDDSSIRVMSIDTTVPNKGTDAWYEGPNSPPCWGNGEFNCNVLPTISPLEHGGQIFTSENTEVHIWCPKRGMRTVPRGRKNNGVPINDLCGSPPSIGIGPLSGKFLPGGVNSLIPYVVGPRYTMVRSRQPLLRWNAVSGASKYTVYLFDDRARKLDDGSLEPICTVQDIIAPPKAGVVTTNLNCWKDSQPYQLELGHFYRIKVDAHLVKITSSDEEVIDRNKYRAEQRGVEGIEFQLISPQQEKEIAESIKTVNQGIQKQEQKSLNIASIYESYNLYAEAIQLLEESVQGGSSNPDVHIRLGDYYAISGLIALAKSSYCKAESEVKLKKDNSEGVYEKELKERWRQIDRLMLDFNRSCK